MHNCWWLYISRIEKAIVSYLCERIYPPRYASVAGVFLHHVIALPPLMCLCFLNACVQKLNEFSWLFTWEMGRTGYLLFRSLRLWTRTRQLHHVCLQRRWMVDGWPDASTPPEAASRLRLYLSTDTRTHPFQERLDGKVLKSIELCISYASGEEAITFVLRCTCSSARRGQFRYCATRPHHTGKCCVSDKYYGLPFMHLE